MNKYFHGTGRRGPYFEGWYLKFQTINKQSLALIPAFHMDGFGRRSASLQIISDSRSWWLEYPDAEFQACQGRFHVRLAQNVFNAKGVWLDIDRPGFSLRGAVQFGLFTHLSSDIMGPFRFVPRMECAHGVLSMGHSLEGSLLLNGEVLDFSGGTGYVETDRGRSFPDRYLWTQCSWGELPHHNSLMLSIATIPLSPLHFTGCICAIICSGAEYRLATYRGVRIQHWGANGAVLQQGKYRLAVELLSGQGQPLRAPDLGGMGRTIHESLASKLRYRFWVGETLLFDHVDRRASFEYASKKETSR